jgi:catechol 2,3-dioxygenase-like lactoylglutathione lyase family enzyme
MPAFSSLPRRRFLSLLPAAAFFSPLALAADNALRISRLDHVSLSVADIPKTVDFYTRLFGNTVAKEKESPRQYVTLGNAYIAIGTPAAGRPTGRVDHYCAGFRNQTVAEASAILAQRQVKFTAPPPFGIFIPDPAAIPVQLWTENSFTDVLHTSAVIDHPSPGAPIFQPLGLDHIVIAVADLAQSAAFYEKIFGPPTGRFVFQAGSSTITLISTRDRQTPGVDHFCVLASKFDYAIVTKQLQSAGATLEAPLKAGSPLFRDPNGILLEVTST